MLATDLLYAPNRSFDFEPLELLLSSWFVVDSASRHRNMVRTLNWRSLYPSRAYALVQKTKHIVTTIILNFRYILISHT